MPRKPGTIRLRRRQKGHFDKTAGLIIVGEKAFKSLDGPKPKIAATMDANPLTAKAMRLPKTGKWVVYYHRRTRKGKITDRQT